jgi:hypothetical protein
MHQGSAVGTEDGDVVSIEEAVDMYLAYSAYPRARSREAAAQALDEQVEE